MVPTTAAAEFETATYDELIAHIKDEVNTAPSGGQYLLHRARSSVREICKALNWWRRTVDHDYVENVIDYPIDHTGYSFCQMLGIYILNQDLTETPDNRLDDGSQDDVELGKDSSKWVFKRSVNYEIAEGAVIRLLYSIMPRIDSTTFPRVLWEQHYELLRSCMLKNMGSYLLSTGNKDRGEMYHERMYRRLLLEEKMRVNEYSGPITISPYYGTPSDNYGGGGYQ